MQKSKPKRRTAHWPPNQNQAERFLNRKIRNQNRRIAYRKSARRMELIGYFVKDVVLVVGAVALARLVARIDKMLEEKISQNAYDIKRMTNE